MGKKYLLALFLLAAASCLSYGNAVYKNSFETIKSKHASGMEFVSSGDESGFARFRKNAVLQLKRPNIIADKGVIKFKFKLDHSMMKPLGNIPVKKLNNQHLLKIVRKDGAYVLSYLSLRGKSQVDLRFGLFDRKNKPVFFMSGSQPIQVNKWYDCRIEYGSETLLYVNGKRIAAETTRGLFGNLPGSSIEFVEHGSKRYENIFSIADVEIQSRYSADARIVLPRIKGVSPKLDGKLDDVFYKECVDLTGFTLFKQGVLSPEQPKVKVGYNEKGLFLAAEIPMPKNIAPRAMHTVHDSRVYGDDAFEVRLQNKPDHHKTFITNCIGTRHESVTYTGRADLSFNGKWQSACRVASDRWFSEIFIPWEAMGIKSMPEKGTQWRGNIYFDRAGGFGSSMTWVPTDAMFENRDGFGTIVFGGSTHALGVEAVKDFMESQPQISVKKVGARLPVVTVYGKLFDQNSRQIKSFDFRLSDTSNYLWKIDGLNAGTYGVTLQAVDSNKQLLLKQNFFFKSDPRPVMNIEKYPYNGYMHVKVRVPNSIYKNKAVYAAFVFMNEKGRTLFRTVKALKRTNADCRITSKDLAGGKYILQLDLLDKKRSVIDSFKHPVNIAEKPEWFNNNSFIDHTVPPPWTPVKAEKGALKVWNRSYIFDGKVLPQMIINNKDKLLAKPLKFTLKLAGKNEPVDLTLMPAEKTQTHPDVITYFGEKRVSDLSIKLRGALEFDGCFRCDLEILPLKKQTPVTVESLVLDIAVADKWGKFFLTGATPVRITDQAISRTFTPSSFVGSEQGGLALFFESSEFWSKNNPQALVIQRKNDHVLWRYNMINAPKKLNKPLKMTWGLIAAPVKDLMKDDLYRFSQHQCHAPEYADPAYVRYDKVKFPDNSGSIEFLMRKAAVSKAPHTEVMRLTAPGYAPIVFYLNRRNLFSINFNRKTVAAAKLPLNHRKFILFTVNYDNKNITVLANGKKVCSAVVTDGMRSLWKELKNSGTVFIGSSESWRVNFCNLVVDEIVLSAETSKGRRGVKKAVKDENTLIIDHLDDSFIPDGFATENLAGGIPSIGSRFINNPPCGKALQLVTEAPKKRWQILKENYYTDVAMFWNWNTPHARQYQWPPAFHLPERAELKKDVAAAREHGLRPIPYAIFPAIGYPSDLAEQFGDEWCVKPVNLMPYAPPAGHSMLAVSMAAKGWVDYLVSGIDKSFKRYNWQGIYTDGAVNILPTNNAAYDCGYTDENGVRHSVYPFFAVREGMKRIYKAVKSDPERFIINHVSFDMPLMTASFSDAVLAGEHERYDDMDTLRIRYNSRPWGIPILLFGNSAHDWSAFCTMSGLLIGDQIWGMTVHGRNEMERKWNIIRTAYEKFQYRSAEFMPFYEAEKVIFGKLPENVHAAAYVKPGKKALLIIANYNKKSAEYTIPLNLSALKITGDFKAVSALNGKTLPVKNNTFKVKLLPENFQLVIVEKQ